MMKTLKVSETFRVWPLGLVFWGWHDIFYLNFARQGQPLYHAGMRFIIFGLSVLFFIIGLTACNPINLDTPPQAQRGVLDLRQWNFAEQGTVKLTGEWEFYWQQLLTSPDFKATPPAMTGFIVVPGHWNGYKVQGHALDGQGYATYRLKVLLNDTSSPFTLIVPRLMLSAHTVYANGQPIGVVGQVGTTPTDTVPQDSAYLTTFETQSKEVELIIQMTNFHNYEGGPLNGLEFGPQSQIYRRNQAMIAFDFIVFGTILIMGLYHLGLFSLRRKDKSPLYFGLACLLITLRILVINQNGFLNLFLTTPWSISMRASVLLSYLPLTVFVLFTQTLFPRQFSPRLLQFIHALNLFFIAITALSDVYTFTASIQPFTFYVSLVFIYLTYAIMAATWQNEEGARIYLFGLLALFATVINDILHANGLIHTDNYVQLGLFMFIFSQAFLLSARFAQAFQQTETLSSQLQTQYHLLAQTQESLRYSEEKYRTLFEDSRDVIFITTLAGEIQEINPICIDLLGYHRNEVLQMNVLDFYVDETRRQMFANLIQSEGAVKNFELKLRHKKGHELDCQLTATLKRDKTGQVIGYQGIIHDVSAYKKAEAERQQALMLQAEANENLKTEIEQRKAHQQEKDHLFELVQQQSEQLRAMTQWLIEAQRHQRQGLSSGLEQEVQQKITLINHNLTTLERMFPNPHEPQLVNCMAETTRLLAGMEHYLTQITHDLEQHDTKEVEFSNTPLLQLSSREQQVLQLVVEGKTNAEIADILTVTLGTVHTYLKRIRRKLDIYDIPGLVKFAQEHGLID